MKRISFISFLLSIAISTLSAQTNKTFFLGHSLINFHVPNMVDKLSIAGSHNFSYDANIGIGASLGWHWTNPTTGQGDQWDLTLPIGGYENFILTEAVPLEGHLQYSNTYRITDSLCTFANLHNPNIQYYFYETWHCINSGNGTTSASGGHPCDWDPNSNTPWRDRIDNDLHKWEGIVDSINLLHNQPMFLIPNGQALGRLYDSIEVGAIPGLSSAFELFEDEHHLDSRGNYFIACVVYAVIHKSSPVGLPNQLTTEFGQLYSVFPTPEQARKMQEIAWQTVCDYPRDGVNCSTVANNSVLNKESIINVYPIPASHSLTIEYQNFHSETSFTIYDQFGKNKIRGILNSQKQSINIAELPSGLYFLSLKDQTIKFIK